MEEIQRPVRYLRILIWVCDSSLRLCGEIRLEEGISSKRMGVLEKGVFMKRSEKFNDGYVVDMESLVHVADKDSNESNLQRTLSRKGSQRVEWKAAVERDTSDAGAFGGVCMAEKSVVVPLLVTPTAEPVTTTPTTTAENRCRRFIGSSSGIGMRSSWLDPRKVLFLFATLSSMGTIILIYFTLSISNIDARDAQAR
ncbi:uncharacterized protein LOC131221440 isoform X2 [Magnolia sinica]|uniref:uncharacterized protein LOC131221440 isoform X2 n=1 Tax=Magnolia sinica TaxID=86752 RepID=UPI0026583223|nr:uncharacterized protein LOC131221440 isoform X2 [Magnolia sinica]